MNNSQKNTPYNDDFLIYDELSGRYVITEEGLKRRGIFLRARLERHTSVDPTFVINAFCEAVANHVYTYMNDHTANPYRLAEVIAGNADLRGVIFRAQAEQAKFVYFNGDQTLSVKPEERLNYISPLAAAALRNAGLLYAGGY